MKFGVVARRDKKAALKLAYRVYDFLKVSGYDVVVDSETYEHLKQFDPGDVLPLEDFDVDVIVVIGGDGTILRVEHKTRKDFPILGVNMGTLGFLAEVEPYETFFALSRFLEGDYYLDERMKIRTYVNGENTVPDALNEDALLTGAPGKIVHLKYYVDGGLADELRSDGLIVATPTGSTGYSLSAGGPFVDPRLDLFVVTPLNPIALTSRPMVVPSTSEIEIVSLPPKRGLILSVDGQFSTRLEPGTVIKVRKSPRRTKFIRFSREVYPKYPFRLKKRF